MSPLFYMECLEPYNAIYLDNTDSGYKIQPCCLYNGNEGTVDSIDKIQAKNQEIWPTLDWEKNCIACLSKERHNEHSKRMESIKRFHGVKDLVRFDIRPGNTCNLKCVMCNPRNSSAWQQDIELWTKYNSDYKDRRNELDWDWIYSKCVDKAEEIYVAGGEPFYMKTVQKFLKKLSGHSWNCENTNIVIQTNGISNTPKFLEILSKFKKLHISISIDGWEDVNELIRFPTKHNEVIKGIEEIQDINPYKFDFNITVQAMNLLNVDTLIQNIGSNYNLFNLINPFYLSINCLKPQVIESCNVKSKELKDFIEDYEYDSLHNSKMQKYLLDLDSIRGTNSPAVVPWCYV